MAEQRYSLILFDVDGTLVEPASGERFRRTPDDWHLLPGRLEVVAVLHQERVPFALVSNQGGVAFGLYEEAAMHAALGSLALLLGLDAERDLYVCYHHEQGTVPELRMRCSRRKPAPGMLREAMGDHDASPQRTLMVGDRPEDEEAARAAGCAFMSAQDFFGVAGEDESADG